MTFKQYMREIHNPEGRTNKYKVPMQNVQSYGYTNMKNVWIHQLREIRALKRENRKLKGYIEDLEFTQSIDSKIIAELINPDVSNQ